MKGETADLYLTDSTILSRGLPAASRGEFKAPPRTATNVGAASLVFKMSWLWSIFAGFYLLAYTFWLPSLFSGLVVTTLAAAVTLFLGFSFLYDGFSTAVALQGGPATKALSLRRLRRLAGGGLLLAYLPVYFPSQGRIVPHWPLDLAITVVSGAIMVIYAIQDR